MKKYFQLLIVLLLLFSLFPAKKFAETTTGTEIYGVISENRTLTKEGSPYIQTGIIDIYPGVTLTIEPGVQLIGKNGLWISVKGKLQAVGTEQDRILLQDVYVKGTDFNNSTIQIEYADHFHQTTYNGGFLVTTMKKMLRYDITNIETVPFFFRPLIWTL
ncbi:hypothetical protein [Bacillus sp. UNCCL81]|uniref:hypothetical protein n=1 Tax=Bacillus sp. UNCCL81 TaxID=1502755 RepID=UPI0008ED259C|nr:hypothetical protein [Bacillus sp. UNCCL81]SFD76209.1 hypothetical protein SAMN02799633_04728 [Bacillus sp. UNCCL81]